MRLEKVGCFFIYSLALIALGMGLYKYRAEVINFLDKKYQAAVQYIQKQVPAKVDKVKKEVKDNA